MCALGGEARQVEPFNLVEVREGDGEFAVVAAGCYGPQNSLCSGLHGLLSIVH